jgi:hypothetical protein
MARLIDLFGETTLSGRDLLTTSPKNLSDMAVSGVVSPSGVQMALEIINRVTPKLDYSDWSKFVFFNSALDYFNISGDRMLVEYPYDGNYDTFLAFRSSSDPYQNYLITDWPHWSGSGYFSGSGSAYITVGDTSNTTGAPALLALSSGTSGTLCNAVTIEYRLLFPQGAAFPGPGNGVTILQHVPASSSVPNFSDPNFSIFIGSGTINFYLSGATFSNPLGDATIPSPSIASMPLPQNSAPRGSGFFMAWVLDPASGTLKLHHTPPGSNAYPFMDTPTGSAQWNFTTGTNRYSTGSSVFVVGPHPSATLPVNLEWPNYQLSELRYWGMARDHDDIYRTYNQRVYRDDPLKIYWRFAEPYTVPFTTMSLNNRPYTTQSYYARDYSGNKLDGRIFSGTSAFWVPATQHAGGFGMSPQDKGEPLLSVNATGVFNYVAEVQCGWVPANPGWTIDSEGLTYAERMLRPLSGSAAYYDRNNANLITNLVPQQYIQIEDEQNTSVMKNLLYLLGRQFDELKVSIDQMSHLLVADYTETDATPDALLDEVLNFWGWSTKGNFLNKEAFQWFFGLGVLDRTQQDVNQGIYSNERLDILLYEIKNEFWRRTLNNLSYLYKTKGTKESVEALFRIHGIDSTIVKLKEYGLKPFVKIETNRINSLKSRTVLRVDPLGVTSSIDPMFEPEPSGALLPAVRNYHPSGSYGVSTVAQSVAVNGGPFTVDMQIAFPAFASNLMRSNIATGSIYHIDQSTGGAGGALAFELNGVNQLASNTSTTTPTYESLRYEREERSGSLTHVGKLVYTDFSGGEVTFDSLPIFDGRWYHISVLRSGTTVQLDIQFLDTDLYGAKMADVSPVSVALPTRMSGTLSNAVESPYIAFTVGASPDATSVGQFWTHNLMIWSLALTDQERLDHTANPLGQGADTPERYNELRLNWQFDKLTDSDTWTETLPMGSSGSYFFDSSQYGAHGYLEGGAPYTGSWNENVYDRFNFAYNFIAPPDYNWTEEKIRYLDNPRPNPKDHWNEINDVGIEFSLIDALNEDISYMMSTMDNWNNIIGDPANKYRENYPTLEKLRQQYFTRLTGRINFRTFIDFLDFFDRSFIELVKRLLPARIDFQGAEVVVESHMLERPKVQWNYRRQNPQLVPEGDILIYGHRPLNLETMVVTPANLTVPGGTQVQYEATIYNLMGSAEPRVVTTSSRWDSSQTRYATIETLGDPNPGLATTISEGGGGTFDVVGLMEGTPDTTYTSGAALPAADTYILEFDAARGIFPYWFKFSPPGGFDADNYWNDISIFLEHHNNAQIGDVELTTDPGGGGGEYMTPLGNKYVNRHWIQGGDGGIETTEVLAISVVPDYLRPDPNSFVGPFSLKFNWDVSLDGGETVDYHEYTFSASFYLSGASWAVLAAPMINSMDRTQISTLGTLASDNITITGENFVYGMEVVIQSGSSYNVVSPWQITSTSALIAAPVFNYLLTGTYEIWGRAYDFNGDTFETQGTPTLQYTASVTPVLTEVNPETTYAQVSYESEMSITGSANMYQTWDVYASRTQGTWSRYYVGNYYNYGNQGRSIQLSGSYQYWNKIPSGTWDVWIENPDGRQSNRIRTYRTATPYTTTANFGNMTSKTSLSWGYGQCELYAIWSVGGGTFDFALRNGNDTMYPTASSYGNPPDTRMTLRNYAGSVLRTNDDASGAPGVIASSMKPASSNYWSFIQWTLSPNQIYYLEVDNRNAALYYRLDIGNVGTNVPDVTATIRPYIPWP